jgi:tetratricopeptide (TPR) repeat protein
MMHGLTLTFPFSELDRSMPNFRPFLSATVTLALCLAAGCSSADTIAANRAAEAQADLNQGRIADARKAIGRAVAARDDVLDYWLLKAQIDFRADDRPSAFGDFEFVVQLDHTNMEALQALCQLGLSAGRPDDVDKYADQLLLLAPTAAAGLTAKGSVALYRGDQDKAESYADRVLAQDPQNLSALALKGRIMLRRGQFADAAALFEKTADSPVSAISKLTLLKEVYSEAHDWPAYERTVRRLAAAAPDAADIQLAYADMLYQEGQTDAARGIIRKIMANNARDFKVAATALNVWMEEGPQALDPGTMVAEAAPLSVLMKAVYGQFANETGHPDIAKAIVRGADQGEPAPENSNAKAVLAYAIGVTGHMPEAMKQLNAILDGNHDPNQPWALLARARLLAASHDYLNAIRDARLLVANDPGNATAHLALADILQASGSSDLSISALREGLRAIPASTRLAARLAASLSAHGQRDQAVQVARDLARTAPMDQRAKHLLQVYDPGSAAARTS